MDYRTEYEKWMNSPKVTDEIKSELSALDEKEIEDRFYKDLEFGTGGLRGIMGAGPNRMNRYTIAKATNADIVRFGSRAEFAQYDPNKNVFDLGNELSHCNMGGTSIAMAFNKINGKVYDRIILLSDNEANTGNTSLAYKNYLRSVNVSPYVYCIDLASYGTTPLKNDGKINYYYGNIFIVFNIFFIWSFKRTNRHVNFATNF